MRGDIWSQREPVFREGARTQYFYFYRARCFYFCAFCLVFCLGPSAWACARTTLTLKNSSLPSVRLACTLSPCARRVPRPCLRCPRPCGRASEPAGRQEGM